MSAYIEQIVEEKRTLILYQKLLENEILFFAVSSRKPLTCVVIFVFESAVLFFCTAYCVEWFGVFICSHILTT